MVGKRFLLIGTRVWHWEIYPDVGNNTFLSNEDYGHRSAAHSQFGETNTILVPVYRFLLDYLR